MHPFFLDVSWMCLDFKEEITIAPGLWRKTLLSTCTCSRDILHLPGLLSDIPWWSCNCIRHLGTLPVPVESLWCSWTRWACLVHLTPVLVRFPFAPEPAGETQPRSHFPSMQLNHQVELRLDSSLKLLWLEPIVFPSKPSQESIYFCISLHNFFFFLTLFLLLSSQTAFVAPLPGHSFLTWKLLGAL